MAAKTTLRKTITGSYLKRMRTAAGISVEAAADEMGLNRSALYRQEQGNSSVSLAEAEKYLRLYRVTDPAVRERFTSLARQSKARGWWSVQPAIEGSVQCELAEMEDMAHSLWTYEKQVVPALIQTPAYSEALITSGDLPGDGIESLIEFRSGRRKVMARDVQGRFHFSFHELAMHDWGGEPQILADQAAHLVQLINEGHDIRMLPFRAGWTRRVHDCVLVSADTKGQDQIAVVQGFPHGAILHDDDALRAVRSMFDSLERNTLTPLDTAQWLSDTFKFD